MKIQNEEIRCGDIVIFDAGDDWLGKSIGWLTKSNVSHAAMVYENETIVEMGIKGISVSPFKVGEGRGAHLLRLVPQQPTTPLENAARKYIEDGIGYDFPALVLLAGLLIYRDIRPTPRWQKITDLIITGACLALDKLLNILIRKKVKEKTMVCSQLVYQIYLDCGKNYNIRVRTLLENRNETNSSEYICLANLLDQTDITASLFSASNSELQLDKLNEETLYQELYEALVESEDLCVSNVSNENLGTTLGKTKQFLDLLEKILEQAHLDIPIPALFITPADLYHHSSNLEKIADFGLTRI